MKNQMPKQETANISYETTVQRKLAKRLGLTPTPNPSRGGEENAEGQTAKHPPMTITVECYRKAYPQEVFFQLEPVLREIGLRWFDILGMLQDRLRKEGFEVFELPDDPDNQMAGEVKYILITNEGQQVPPTTVQISRITKLVRYEDGTCRQGFGLHANCWSANSVETLFVPYGDTLFGELVECRYDAEALVWRPTDSSKPVMAKWSVHPVSPQEAQSARENPYRESAKIKE